MKSKTLSVFIACCFFTLAVKAQQKQDDIIGIWLTAGKEPAKIQVYQSGNIFYGKIIWLQNPVENGKPRVDSNNPDKDKRNDPVIGLQLLKDFQFDGNDEWTGGEIYDPESGKTYKSFINLKDKNTLKVRGYVGISLFGRTETWTRVL